MPGDGSVLLLAQPAGLLEVGAQLAYAGAYGRTLASQHAAPPQTATDADAALALRAVSAGDGGLVQELYLRGGYFSAADVAALSDVAA